MKKIDEMESILGWKPGRGMRLEILKIMKEKGICLGEATALFQMSKLYTDFDNTGYIDTSEGRMLIEDYIKLHPWNKIVVIHGPEARRNKKPDVTITAEAIASSFHNIGLVLLTDDKVTRKYYSNQ
ncbi:MAG: hypothetical protein Q7U54_03670 [Bacteroidales bacterium]|nr:hypothetical protein [Bacteroidales bacterium]